MKSKLIIVGSKVRRLPEQTSLSTWLRSQLTVRNIIGFLGMLVIAAWIVLLIIGGA